jgi:hypothetical protein
VQLVADGVYGHGVASVECAGSYRRGKPDSGDVDMLVTPLHPRTGHDTLPLEPLTAALHRAGLLIFDLRAADAAAEAAAAAAAAAASASSSGSASAGGSDGSGGSVESGLPAAGVRAGTGFDAETEVLARYADRAQKRLSYFARRAGGAAADAPAAAAGMGAAVAAPHNRQRYSTQRLPGRGASRKKWAGAFVPAGQLAAVGRKRSRTTSGLDATYSDSSASDDSDGGAGGRAGPAQGSTAAASRAPLPAASSVAAAARNARGGPDPAAATFPPPGWQTLELHPDAYVTYSYMGLGRLPNAVGARVRRIDIKSYPRDLSAFALLYFTGSDHFNRSMRLFCHKVGWTLSDRGLSPAVRRKRDKVWTGHSVRCDSEADIFEAIGAPFKPPHERNCEIATTAAAGPRAAGGGMDV